MPEQATSDRNLTWADFTKVEMRVGTVLRAYLNEKAHKPAYVLHLDFGVLGERKTSAQVTDHYRPEDLVGRQVIAVVNFPPKQIANMVSECLVLGAVGEDGGVILLNTDQPVPNGLRIG
ncbi:MAG: tRNA-binding protein [Phaeodactylibacter sp.]|uniref:tRNA-binding protein n=1 Tax=Phaeodactylibacter sp. TaxID=1940289 RepID=UPI0032EE94B6